MSSNQKGVLKLLLARDGIYISNSNTNLRNVYSSFLTAIFIANILLLLILHVSGILASIYFGGDHFLARQLVKLFYFDREYNFPSWFSACLLFSCGLSTIMMAAISFNKKHKYVLQWILSSLIFFLLSADESIALHEWIIPRALLLVPSFGHSAWVIVAFPFLILISLFYLKLLLSLPLYTKIMFIMSAIVYLTGAVIFEMIGAKILLNDGIYSANMYRIIMTIEETLEMLGCIAFIHAVTSYYYSLVASKIE